MASGKRKTRASAAKPRRAPSRADLLPVCPVVGLGASAGGLEALTDFFTAVRGGSGMAFVVVSHLDPEHKSALAEILAKTTRMSVVEVRDRMTVEPDHVYVIPPKAEMVIAQGALNLAPRPEGRQPPMPIDAFLCSLAAECKSQAIGVILSGTGTDGTRGLKAIKAEGGVTFAQDQTARHDGMPRSAVQAGCVDFVLSPAHIAAELVRIGRCPYADSEDAKAGGAPRTARDDDDFQAILQLLGRATQVNFTHYKHSTLWRRMQRRMLLRKLPTLGAYLECLRSDGPETQALFEEMLLQVSGFFRDPEVFDALQQTVFPELLADRSPDAPLRIWVPGCATGEEVYSLAMCVLEAMEEKSVRAPLKVFATDISDKALAAARAGDYADHAVTDVSPARLRRFFEKTPAGYRIQKTVRDVCVFARQDVTRDPPFSQLDLVSCRNLLIYLDATLQARVLPIFHYALKPGGFLVLGTAETVGGFTELFQAADPQHKIYRRTGEPTRLAFDFAAGAAGRDAPSAGAEAGEPGGAQDIRREADRVVLARYAPCGVVVDEQLRIVQFRGHTGAYLEPAPGTPTLDLFQMVRPGLLADLRHALEQAQRDRRPVRHERIRIDANGRDREFHLEVVPISLPASEQRYYVILFEEPAAAASAAPARRGRGSLATSATSRGRGAGATGLQGDVEIAHLKDELAATRHYLQAIIEEKEAANEELKAANEEIVSSNEELQSTNEELETAKEEVQATNEELTTVNDELQNRIQVAAQLSDDLANLIDSVNIPTLVVDAHLRLRRFSPSSQRVLSLVPTDVGRHIGDFKLKINLPGLEPLIQEVLDTLAVQELEVTDQHGCWYRMAVRAYKTSDHRIDGAVITLMDIDQMKRDMTDRKELERELLEIATREQQRIGQDLHDSVGQDLTALGYLAESLGETLAGQKHADAGLAGKITSGLRQVFSRVRLLTQGLMPVEVDAAGLMTALAELAKRLSEQSGVPCTFTCAEPAYVQNNQIATHLYRIAQEAVTNALKHARPRHIRISLDSSDGPVALRVADDGAGMPGQAPEAGSMGLRIMRHRAGLINAVLTIDSAPGRGTVVACTLGKDSRHDQKHAEGAPTARPDPDR